MNIHIITPYEAMIPIINDCIPYFPELNIRVSVGDLENGLKIALLDDQKDTDIIISRGGTAKLIKEAVKIPVLDMKVSGYDMMRSLTLASNLSNKTAIVGFSNITSAAQSIIDLMELPLSVYTVQNSEEVAPLIVELKNKGYQQIVGDFITYKTSNAYGLKGLLIQSGKESIMNALENAKQLYSYLNKRNNTSKIFEQMLLKKYENLLILDEANEVVYEQFTNIVLEPEIVEQVNILNTSIEINKKDGSRKYVFNDYIIEINGYFFAGNQYKLFTLKKHPLKVFSQQGLTIMTSLSFEPLIIQSERMQNVYDQLQTYFQQKEPILLLGQKGTGKDFISTFIHQQKEIDGLLLTIDFELFDVDIIDTIPLQNVRTIKFIRLEIVKDVNNIIPFIKKCMNLNIHLFILSEVDMNTSLFNPLHINKIQLPPLLDRQEDFEPFVHYFISKYHEQLGTRAIKMKNEALSILQKANYPSHIDDLKYIVKQITLTENDYVIHQETVEQVLQKEKASLKSISFKGTLKEIEKEIIEIVLKEENYNQSKTAERLGINRATLWRKLKE